MGLKDKIKDDIKNAMRAKDAGRLSVLRMVLSEITYAQAQVNVHAELPDADVLKVVAAYQKKLTKSLEDYPAGEQANAIKAEIKIVEEYLPKKATDIEVNAAIAKVLTGTTDRNFGSVMKLVMAELGDSGDGRLVSQLLKEKLS